MIWENMDPRFHGDDTGKRGKSSDNVSNVKQWTN